MTLAVTFRRAAHAEFIEAAAWYHKVPNALELREVPQAKRRPIALYMTGGMPSEIKRSMPLMPVAGTP